MRKKRKTRKITYHRRNDERQHEYDNQKRYQYTSPVPLILICRHQLHQKEENEKNTKEVKLDGRKAR